MFYNTHWLFSFLQDVIKSEISVHWVIALFNKPAILFLMVNKQPVAINYNLF